MPENLVSEETRLLNVGSGKVSERMVEGTGIILIPLFVSRKDLRKGCELAVAARANFSRRTMGKNHRSPVNV